MRYLGVFKKCLFLAFLALSPARGADLQIAASLDRDHIAMGEQAVLSISISGPASKLPEPQIPAIPEFQIYNAGTSQSMNWINGQVSSSVAYKFVLAPKKEGTFTIPAIKIDQQQTAPMTLTVAKASNATSGGVSAGAPGSQLQSGKNSGEPGIFITTTVDRKSLIVGEPVTLSFRLYHRVPLLSQPNYQPPTTSGFWAEDLPPQRTYETTVKGVAYRVVEVRTALFPTTAGRATIGPARIQVRTQDLSDPFNDDFFGSFFGGGQVKTLETNPIILQVSALPDPKPSGFKGAVGSYRLSASLDKNTVEVGQPITLTLTVSGKGNIKSLPDLPLPAIPNFRTFDTNAATNIDKKNGQVEGSKVFRTVLIPTTSGELTIPSVSFVFFDSASRSYQTVSSKPLAVRVTGSAAAVAPLASSPGSTAPPAPAPVQMLSQDIRYIHTGELGTAGAPVHERLWFRWLHGILGVLLLGALFIPLIQRRLASNPVQARFKAARGEAIQKLKQAEKDVNAAQLRSAANHLADAVRDFIAGKLGVSKNALSSKEAWLGLTQGGLTADEIARGKAVWDSVDVYQFAPSQIDPVEFKRTIEAAREWILQVDSKVSWRAMAKGGSR